jgi:hypothetical protein
MNNTDGKKTIVITITEVTEIKKGNPSNHIDNGIIETRTLYTQTFDENNTPNIGQLIRFANGEEPSTPPRRRCI